MSSSQLPVPAAEPQPVPIVDGKGVKTAKLHKGPVGRMEIMEWQATLCCLTPLGTCYRQQSADSIYCLQHTCQAINVDGQRCGNSIHNFRQSRFCNNGWHVENSKYGIVVDMVDRRRQADEINAARRKIEIAEQLALFELQFTNVITVDKRTSSSARSSPIAIPNQNKSREPKAFH